jgi:hypothetical protein
VQQSARYSLCRAQLGNSGETMNWGHMQRQ